MPNPTNPHYDLVPARIRQFRKHLGLSQVEFGGLLEMDQTVISGMETARQDPTLKTIYQLIDKGCNPGWLLLGEGPMIKPVETVPSLEVRQLPGATEYVIRVKLP